MKLLKTHHYNFTPHINGGEGLTLTTNYYDNGDGPSEPFIDQDLTLLSYGNSATFHLNDILTPNKLRELANQLEDAQRSLSCGPHGPQCKCKRKSV